MVHNPSMIFLSQQKDVDDLLHKLPLHTCKLVRTPCVARTTFFLPNSKLLLDFTEYWSMIGCFIVAFYDTSRHIRLDIDYVLHIVSQVMHLSHVTYVHSVKCIFWHVQGTLNHDLHLQPSAESNVIVACDARWLVAKILAVFTVLCAIYFGTNLERSKKQPTISKSCTKACRVSSYWLPYYQYQRRI